MPRLIALCGTLAVWCPIVMLPMGCSEDLRATIPVQVAGCSRLIEGQCAVHAKDDVTLWAGTDRAPRVWLRDEAFDATWTRRGDGWRTTVPLREGALRLETLDGQWAIPITQWRPAPQLSAAYEDLAGGDQDAALAKLGQVWNDERGTAVGFEAHWILVQLGATGSAMTLSAIADEAVEAGAWYWAWRAATTEATALATVERRGLAAIRLMAQAREHAERLEPVIPLAVGFGTDYIDGFSHQNAGDQRSAIRLLSAAATAADRSGDWGRRALAQRLLAESLSRAGRGDEAVQLITDLIDEGREPNACAAAGARSDLAWVVMQRSDATPDALDHAHQLLVDAIDGLTAATDCAPHSTQSHVLAIAHLNLALLAIRQGDPTRGAHHLAQSRDLDPALASLWRGQAEGQSALLRGDPAAALQVFRDMEDRAGSQLEFGWMALVGQARALDDLDRLDDAIVSAARAAEVLYQQSTLVPTHDGQAAFLDERQRSVIHHADLLLRQGRTREAFDVYRTHRAQYLFGLQQSRRMLHGPPLPELWLGLRDALDEVDPPEGEPTRGPRDAHVGVGGLDGSRRAAQRIDAALGSLGFAAVPSPVRQRPDPGELMVGWFPSDRGWVGFAEDDTTIDIARIDDAALPPAQALVAPFLDRIGGATRITLVLAHPLQALDLHAVEVGSVPLVARVPIAYGLDLSGRPEAEVWSGSAALFVDPTGDLPGARDEARALLETFASHGWPARHFERSDATQAAFVESLPQVGLVHFSGHASAGAGWDASLRVADGMVGVASVIGASSVPGIVVLNACETSRRGDAGAVPLAHAFLVAGADVVIASQRPVKDALAARFSIAFYAALAETSSPTLAYHTALTSVVARLPSEDWATFRLLQP